MEVPKQAYLPSVLLTSMMLTDFLNISKAVQIYLGYTVVRSAPFSFRRKFLVLFNYSCLVALLPCVCEKYFSDVICPRCHCRVMSRLTPVLRPDNYYSALCLQQDQLLGLMDPSSSPGLHVMRSVILLGVNCSLIASS